MRKIRTIIAALLVAVFVLGALNVSGAGVRQRLTERIARLQDRVGVLEEYRALLLIEDVQLGVRVKRLELDQDAIFGALGLHDQRILALTERVKELEENGP